MEAKVWKLRILIQMILLIVLSPPPHKLTLPKIDLPKQTRCKSVNHVRTLSEGHHCTIY